jgi:hypothetical protein
MSVSQQNNKYLHICKSLIVSIMFYEFLLSKMFLITSIYYMTLLLLLNILFACIELVESERDVSPSKLSYRLYLRFMF